MCGIWFSIGANGGSRHVDDIAHRGPDGEGWKTLESPRGEIALGHRRLAVVDLRKIADQPFSDPEERATIVFNGEIYNHTALRSELESMGEVFRTDCDTEVLLLGLRKHGSAFIERLEGMFAFAFLDLRRRTVIAARDRFGIKPLYLRTAGSNLALASEIKQFRHLPDFRLRPDATAMQQYADGFGYPTCPRTMFEGIHEFEPGCLLETSIDEGGHSYPNLRRWYEPQIDERESGSLEENAEFYREELTRSIESHLQADVPIGCCLSGGLDSTMIAAMAAKRLGTRLTSVTASFPGTFEDEWTQARLTAEEFRLPSNEVRVDLSKAIARLDQVSFIHDEPLSSTSPIAQWCVFEQAAATGLKVMLDGQGPDECLGGYPTMVSSHIRHLWRTGRYFAAVTNLMTMRDQLGGLHGVIGGLRRRIGGRPRPVRSDIDRAPAPGRQRDQFQEMVFQKSLPRLLQWEDRNSMAHGVESRVPFLDHRLVEFSLRLPVEQRIGGGWTKRVLREAARDIVPDRIRLHRVKRGFLVPPLEQDGETREATRHWLKCSSDRLGLTQSHDQASAEASRLDTWRRISLGGWSHAFDLSL